MNYFPSNWNWYTGVLTINTDDWNRCSGTWKYMYCGWINEKEKENWSCATLIEALTKAPAISMQGPGTVILLLEFIKWRMKLTFWFLELVSKSYNHHTGSWNEYQRPTTIILVPGTRINVLQPSHWFLKRVSVANNHHIGSWNEYQ